MHAKHLCLNGHMLHSLYKQTHKCTHILFFLGAHVVKYMLYNYLLFM